MFNVNEMNRLMRRVLRCYLWVVCRFVLVVWFRGIVRNVDLLVVFMYKELILVECLLIFN